MTSRLLAAALFVSVILLPSAAQASGFSDFLVGSAQADTLPSDASSAVLDNSQQMPIVTASNIGPGMLSGNVVSDTDPVITDAALAPSMGPVGNASDAAALPDASAGITFYTVQAGDTIGSVAEMFGVTKATILSANDLNSDAVLKKDAVLVILPVSGAEYTVKKGDTIKTIAKKYGVDPSDITFANNLDPTAAINEGDTLIIPDSNFSGTSETGDSASASTANNAPSKKAGTSSSKEKGKAKVPINADGLDTTNYNGASTTPITVHPAKLTAKIDVSSDLSLPLDPNIGRLSQGLHGWNNTAVDIAAPLGTPIHAIADGTILLAITGGYNGGYGNYVILESVVDGHKVESIYGHMSKVAATVGQAVSAGDTIGYVGKTGDATGYHLHIEVRGAINPFLYAYKRQ